ncbi:hypothetical protein GCM10023319_55680 [Nocardia iowensis]
MVGAQRGRGVNGRRSIVRFGNGLGSRLIHEVLEIVIVPDGTNTPLDAVRGGGEDINQPRYLPVQARCRRVLAQLLTIR